jgi:hypothetical protein
MRPTRSAYRPLAAFVVLCLPVMLLASATGTTLPDVGLLLPVAISVAGVFLAAGACAAGRLPLRGERAGSGMARVLDMRRHRLRHTVEFAAIATGFQTLMLASFGVWPVAAETLTALFAADAVAAGAGITRGACTIGALRRALGSPSAQP